MTAPADIIEKVKYLREKITDADYRYYVLADPDIDDYSYDMMLKELDDIEKKYPAMISDDSPTQRVSGMPTRIFRTVKHKVPMLSLSNSYNFNELIEFDNRINIILSESNEKNYEYICEFKFDGIYNSYILL